jgi:tRNA threonylcarbamoyladenosine biosynthesis protein TsaB
MHSYIAIQNTYHIFEIALIINNTMYDTIHEDKRHASKLFIPLLDQLLTKNNRTLESLSFCAVNCGPGPFSTLRSIIACANGLKCATNIPLISVDGLDALFLETYNPDYPYTIILLNAFNNDIYYLIAHHNTIVSKGYKKIDAFLDYIKQTYLTHLINFVGNGVSLHQNLIKSFLGPQAIIAEPIIEFCSINTVARLGLHAFETNNYTPGYLMPLHLKKHAVEELMEKL